MTETAVSFSTFRDALIDRAKTEPVTFREASEVAKAVGYPLTDIEASRALTSMWRLKQLQAIQGSKPVQYRAAGVPLAEAVDPPPLPPREFGVSEIESGPDTKRPAGIYLKPSEPAEPEAKKPKKQYKRKARSRVDKWTEAASEALAALDDAEAVVEEVGASGEIDFSDKATDEQKAQMNAAMGRVEDALSTLRDLQTEYGEWRENLPESQEESATAEKLDAVAELDLEYAESDDLDELRSKVQEAEEIDLPRGFGRD